MGAFLHGVKLSVPVQRRALLLAPCHGLPMFGDIQPYRKVLLQVPDTCNLQVMLLASVHVPDYIHTLSVIYYILQIICYSMVAGPRWLFPRSYSKNLRPQVFVDGQGRPQYTNVTVAMWLGCIVPVRTRAFTHVRPTLFHLRSFTLCAWFSFIICVCCINVKSNGRHHEGRHAATLQKSWFH